MEYIYSAMVLHSVGKEISEDGILRILTAAEKKDIDKARIKALVSSLADVNIEEAIETAAMPVAAAAAAPAAGAAPSGDKKEEKKDKEEEEEEEVSEEEAAAGLGALFG